MNRLKIEKLSQQLERYSEIDAPPPSAGWIRTIRETIGMSLQQLANRLQITRQSMHELEIREQDGSISLNKLKEVADALGMNVVYGFVPIDGTLEDLIQKRARELAERIVRQSSHTMMLEDQAVSDERIERAIRETTDELLREHPKSLWE